jgi:hypothetical protein
MESLGLFPAAAERLIERNPAVEFVELRRCAIRSAVKFRCAKNSRCSATM